MEIEEVVKSIFSEDMSFKEKAILVQNKIVGMQDVLSNDKEIEEVNPLEHTFADGMYIRKVFMPAGQLIISKTHTQKHPYFILSGVVSVIDENGTTTITAPYNGITEAGTKRILAIHEDTIWVTVQRTEHTDVDKITEELMNDDYDPQLLTDKQKELL